MKAEEANEGYVKELPLSGCQWVVRVSSCLKGAIRAPFRFRDDANRLKR